MDLGAYVNIEALSDLAKKNGIVIPRLRGYRLMEKETPLTDEELQSLISDNEANAACNFICGRYYINPTSYEYSRAMDRKLNYYLVKKDGEYVRIRWDRFHGKKRKNLKYVLKRQRRDILNQFAAWNRYAGQKNVLYIHSRMGGWNWNSYEGKNELMNQPWFLNRVDDWYDHTYCDFYALIKEGID